MVTKENVIDWNRWRIISGGTPEHFRVQQKGLFGWYTMKDDTPNIDGLCGSPIAITFSTYNDAEKYIVDLLNADNFKVCKKT